LATRIRAEEVVAINAATLGGALVLALGLVGRIDPPGRLALAAILLLGLVGAVAPQAWLERKADERTAAIQRALPDVLDLMAISVEAGVGLDAAMMVATEHLDNPLTSELGLTLTEMELGLPRRQALQNLRRRADIPELSSVVVALLQADELGMPIGHVLRLQGTEMRAKRRMRAREQAGKLPVKIIFPLVLFIFPPILVILMGPAMGSLAKAF
jgi:tight adherence protein C